MLNCFGCWRFSRLRWLQSTLYEDSPDDAWKGHWEGWRDLILSRPKAWKGLLRKAIRRDVRGDVLREGWQQCRGMLFKCLLQAGAYVQAQCDESRSSQFFCGMCCTRFQSSQQWAVHAFKRHGILKPTRVLTPGSQCPACLKQYATNIALCNHLDRSERCIVCLVRAGFSHEPQPGIGHSRADRGLNFLGAVRQAHGPLPLEVSGPSEPSTQPLKPFYKLCMGRLRFLLTGSLLAPSWTHIEQPFVLHALTPGGLQTLLRPFRLCSRQKRIRFPLQLLSCTGGLLSGFESPGRLTGYVVTTSQELLAALDFSLEPSPDNLRFLSEGVSSCALRSTCVPWHQPTLDGRLFFLLTMTESAPIGWKRCPDKRKVPSRQAFSFVFLA